MKRWLNVREVAEQLGVAVTTVYGLCQERKIQHIRVGSGKGAIRISEQALADYLRAAMVEVEGTAQ